MEVALVEHAPRGDTVEEATTRFAIDQAAQAPTLRPPLPLPFTTGTGSFLGLEGGLAMRDAHLQY